MNTRTFSQQLGTDVVKIFVGKGKEKQEFIVHRELCCDKIPAFNRMFNGGFQEGITKSATLSEGDPKAFAAVVEWIYRGTIMVVRLDIPDDDDNQASELVELYTFASKYMITEVADRALAALIKHSRYTRQIPLLEDLLSYYAASLPGSKMRRFVVDMAADRFCEDYTDLQDKRWSTEKFRDVFKLNEDLMLDVLISIRLMLPPHEICSNPRFASACKYHEHDKAKSCPYHILSGTSTHFHV